MGLFSQIFGRGNEPDRYRSEMQQQSNRLYHIERISGRMIELRPEGISNESCLQLQCIFTTDTKDKTIAFKSELEKIGYKSNWEKPRDGDFLIFGYTQPMPMNESALLEWAALMCELGEASDCEFADWLPVRPGEER